jgi:hypothetical protein
MNATFSSDGRLTFSGWLLNQLDSPGFARRIKNLLSVEEGYKGGPFLSRRFYRCSTNFNRTAVIRLLKQISRTTNKKSAYGGFPAP